MVPIRKTLTSALAGTALVTGVSLMPASSHAGDGGAVALGAIGGLAAGAMIGGALSGPRYYAPPPPPPVYGYRAYYPAYPDYDECPARRVWSPYGWRWIHDC